MAIQCTACGNTVSAKSSLHLVTECPKCHNRQRDKFIRVEDKDINPLKHEEDRKWLETNKAE